MHCRYKKNLKRLFIVHPSFWVKMMFGLCRPFISSKFWKKLSYIDDLAELYSFIPRSELTFPEEVLRYAIPSKSRIAAMRIVYLMLATYLRTYVPRYCVFH